MKPLITNTITGEVSTAKVWRQIAYAVATWVIIINANGISWELLIAYLSIVAGSELGQKIVEAKFYGRGENNHNRWSNRYPDRPFDRGLDGMDFNERPLRTDSGESEYPGRSSESRDKTNRGTT